MKNYNKLIVLFGMLAFIFCIPQTICAKVKEHDVRELVPVDDISYVETTDDIDNPGRGFYKSKCISYSVSGNKSDTYAPLLYHMRLDISHFAAAYNNENKDIELSEDMLNALDATLDNLEKNHSSAIIRFAYDPKFGGKDTVHEPSIEMINRHQEQLGQVLSRHSDCIVSVEVGLFGKWGEMHSGDRCNADNFNKAINKWLEVLPESIPISVRTPGFYADWAGVDRSKLNENVTVKGTDAYRVGIYNDGYLGSDSDFGTFAKRDTELAWLNNQSKHTLYGGELAANDNEGTVKNTAAYMEKEAFVTHTSYLNVGWNKSALDAMRNEAYNGNDDLYKGLTGFDYIRNHLGYRYVVRGVRLTQKTTDFEDFCLEANIANVGFANVVKDKKAVLIISGKDNTYYIPIEKNIIDPNEWDSGKTTNIKIVYDLPEDMPLGDYKVYLRIASDVDSRGLEGYPIRFANEDKAISGTSISNTVWNVELGANYLADMSIVDTFEEDDDNEIAVVRKGKIITVSDKYNSIIKLKITSENKISFTGNARIINVKSSGKVLNIKDIYTCDGISYKITEIASNACKNNKKSTTIIIGKNVKKIGKNAFLGIKKCKKLIIKTDKLTSRNVGRNAFGKMNKKMKVYVPKKKLKAYKKWLYKKGLLKTAKLLKYK